MIDRFKTMCFIPQWACSLHAVYCRILVCVHKTDGGTYLTRWIISWQRPRVKAFRPGCMVTVLKEAGRKPQAVTRLLGDSSAGLRCATRDECGEGGCRWHVSCLRWGCVANTLPRGDLLWPLSAPLWGRPSAPPGMQMNGHKRQADTATETMVEKKKGKWDHGEKAVVGEEDAGGEMVWKARKEEGRRSSLPSQRAH